jgi:hypothetical protein
VRYNSDVRLRELERRFQRTGDVEDEAAWLQARVRAGDLDRVAVERAASLGYPAAMLISPEWKSALRPKSSLRGPGWLWAELRPTPWRAGMDYLWERLAAGERGERGEEFPLRVGIAVARSVLPILRPGLYDLWRDHSGRRMGAEVVLEAAERWLETGDRQDAQRVLAEERLLSERLDDERGETDISEILAVGVFGNLAMLIAQVAGLYSMRSQRRPIALSSLYREATEAWREAITAEDSQFTLDEWDETWEHAERIGHDRIASQVRGEVVPWLLQ